MTQVLFITPAEVRERTSLDNNVDDNKIINAIIFAQDLTIEPLLGTVMFDEMKQQVINGTLEDKYKQLIDYHIRKTLISTVLHKITLFLIYRFNNIGVQKNNTASMSGGAGKQATLSTDEIKELRNEVSEYVFQFHNGSIKILYLQSHYRQTVMV